VNESLFELQEPPSKPTMIILFFHGFYTSTSTDTHLHTWESEDGSCIWPQKWLLEDFAGVRVLYVSYNARLGTGSEGNQDMYLTAENLTSDLMEAQIGETPNCPIIMVGHCLGGLVIKQLCLHMNARKDLTRFEKEKSRLENILGNLKGVFYYGTPHNGNLACIDKAADGVYDNTLLKYFKALNQDGSRLSFEFSLLARKQEDWQIRGLGESKITQSGAFKGVIVAPEPSARDGDHFYVLPVDHISISKPQDKMDRRFYAFTGLLGDIVQKLQVK
jgi:hypothetical protein